MQQVKKMSEIQKSKFRMDVHVACRESECLLADQVKEANMKFADLKQDYKVNLVLHKNNKLFLSELYNKILKELRSNKNDELDYVAFCHSDVAFDVDSVVSKLTKLKQKYDIIGFAGAKKLNLTVTPLGWWPASGINPEERYGHIKNIYNNQLIDSFFNLQTHPNVADTRVATVDGLCMMLGRNIIADDNNLFDEIFKSNHFYDLDFCLRNLLAGKSIGVVVEHIFHASVGMAILSDDYKEVEKIFREKWKSLYAVKAEK